MKAFNTISTCHKLEEHTTFPSLKLYCDLMGLAIPPLYTEEYFNMVYPDDWKYHCMISDIIYANTQA